MKKIYLLFCALVAGTASFAQTVTNGDMELWRSNLAGTGITVPKSTIQAPVTWYGGDSLFIGLGQAYGSLIGTEDSDWHVQLFQEDVIMHGGAHSAKVMTRFQDTLLIPGVVSNAKTNVAIIPGFPPKIGGLTYSGGMPVTVKPVTVSGWVQYFPGIDSVTHVTGNDSGYLTVQAIHQIGTKDSVIGTGRVNIGPTGSAWVEITANISYPLDTVDSVNLLRITFASSGGGLTFPCDSSTLYVDDVSMTSVPNPIPVDHTGVRMLAANDVVAVYPNPAKGTIYLDGPKNAGLTCKLFSVTGTVVITKALNGNDVLDVASLPAGNYFYTIADAGGITVQRGKVAVSK